MNPITIEIKNQLIGATKAMNENLDYAKIVVHLKNNYEDIYLLGMDENEK